MRKLTLDMDALEIQSFETAEKGEERGTVRAASTDAGDCTVGWTGYGNLCPSTPDMACPIEPPRRFTDHPCD
jgi:hypothetical protein